MQITFTHPLTKKLCLLSFLILFAAMPAMASPLAPPVISSFSPAAGPVGTSVTISGSNFNATASSNIVFFGATMASVTSASTTSLTVTVPTGATYAPITVLNGSTHLSGYSSQPFIVVFAATRGITSSTFASPQTFSTGTAPQFVAVADVDGDGRADIVVVNQNDYTIGVFRNKSTYGSITSSSFAAEVTFSTGSGSYPNSIAIGDLDGDGKLDVVTANTGNASLSVFRNTSSVGNISFAAHADFATGNADPSYVAIADFDSDGKPDMAVTNAGTTNVSVFHNTTTSGSTTISFATHADYAVNAESAGIAVADLDGDGKPDIAAVIGSTNYVSVLHNTSSSGSISFGTHADFSVGSGPVNLSISDIDNDGKLDIVTSNGGDGSASVLRNNSSSGSVSFVSHQDINVDEGDPNESFYTVVMNDLDGDGKPDMMVVDNNDALYLLRNTSSSGSPSFGSKVTVAVGTNSYALYGAAVGDFDGDGKPDIVANAQGDNLIDVLRNNLVTLTTTTTTTLSSSLNPSYTASPNNSVTFTATVTSAGSPVTQGTVNFTSNGAGITGGTTVPVNGSGQATVSTTFSTVGSYSIQATYNANSTYSSSTSSTLTQQVNLHPTTVSSITANSTYSNASSIQFTATFAASITGLSASNFSLSTTGAVSGASVASVSGSGTTYAITVNTGTGDGTIGLNLANATGLTPGISNVPYTGGMTNIDKTAPTVSIGSPSVSSIITGTGSVSYTVTYADANFNKSTLTTGDITLNTTGTANGTVGLSGSGTSYSVTISGITGTGTLGISIGASTASDLAGNTAAASGVSSTFNVVYSTDATLSNMVYSKGVLNPVFAPGTTSYVNYIPNITTSLTVTPTTNDPNATVAVNGTTVTSGTASAAIPLAVGTNTITTTVTAQDGSTTKSYIVSVIRSPSTNNLLSSLTLTPTSALTVVAGPDYKDYTATVSNTTTSIQVTPTTSAATATVTVNGATVASATASAPISLSLGANTITTVVTAEDGVSTKTYVITVTRSLSNNANLSSLRSNPFKAITQVTGPDNGDYVSSVPNSTASVQIIPTTAVTTSTVTVNGATVASGSPSTPIALAVGTNTITTVVTAQDGVTTHNYVLTITRAAASMNSVYETVSVSNPTDHQQIMAEEINVHQSLSPNGDGINDFLMIDGIANYPDNKLTIINRSGAAVFEAKGYDNSNKVFDGHSNKNGAMQLPGTYFYSLDYVANGTTKHKTGFIVLKY